MSEAKGPGMESDGAEIAWNRWILSLDVIRPGTDMSFDTFVAGYSAGRASRDGLREASQWALEFFKARDEMNAKVHCSPIRLSPITERFMKALEADGEEGK